MKRIQTRALVEGAIFAAITVVIGIIRFYIPLIAVISILWSIPTILIAFRHGFKVSIYSVLVSSALVAVITQPIEGLGFFIGFGLPGIIMGYLLKKKVSPAKTIFITSLVLAVCSVLSTCLGMLAVGMNIVKAYNQMFVDMKNICRDAINSMADAYSAAGMNHDVIRQFTELFEKSLDMMKLIVPISLWVSGILLSFLNFKLTRLVLKRINYTIEDVTPFSLWRLSNKGMGFAASLLLFTIVEFQLVKLPQLYTLTLNLYMLVMVIFIALGMSVAKFFLDKFNLPKAVTAVLLILLLLIASNIAMIVGITDILLDFRKLRNKPAEGI